MHRILGTAALAAFLASPAFAADAKFALDGENTKIEWVGKKADGEHKGGFEKLTGTATVAGDDVKTLKLDLTIQTESITSDDEKLTAHLKNQDFFSVKQHPKATFKSTKVEETDEGYEITGDLTLLGKKKSVTFPADIMLSGDSLKIESKFEIDRTKFGMNYGEGKVNKEVELTVKVDAATK